MKKFGLMTLMVILVAACAPNTSSTILSETSVPTSVSSAATAIDTVQATDIPSDISTIDAGATILPTEPLTTTAEGTATLAVVSPVASLPTWQTLSLTNARTGETFTFADFAGKTVFVEPMATWCTNCRQQLGNVRSVYSQLDASQYVFVGLSVETNISASDLAQYADDNDFDWLFAVITPELLGELSAAFGRTITNPPSTPHFIIRPNGTTTDLTTGIESSEQILEQLNAANQG